jgi:hypothetical protein
MKIRIITKNFGTQVIDTEWFDANKVSPKSTIFKAVEYVFNEWYKDACEHDRDVRGCYKGWADDEPAIYSKRGAIIAAIEYIVYEYAVDHNKHVITSKDLLNMDLEACFEL